MISLMQKKTEEHKKGFKNVSKSTEIAYNT